MAAKTRRLVRPAAMLIGVLIGVLMLLLVVMVLPTVAQSQANPSELTKASAEKVVSTSELVSNDEEAKKIREYWTRERMESAKPILPDRSSGASRDLGGPTGPDGPAKKIDGSIPKGLQKAPIADSQATTQAATTQAATTQAATSYYSYPFPYSRVAVPTSYYNSYPYSTMGKVFFEYWTGQNWQGSKCSGTVVAAENKSTVWTAGHCVRNAGNGGRMGALTRNWNFVPAYKNGYAPFGEWPAKYLYTTSGWAYNGHWGYDLGAAVVYPASNGARLANRVGSLGITWNQAVRQNWRAFGYPEYDYRAPEMNFDGKWNYMCTAPTAVFTDYNAMGIGCDMTGGASGGGWTIGLSSSGGWVNSVNSHKDFRYQPKAMYGPYQGTAAANLFNSVRSL